ncbi:hypothetical protein HCC61_23765 [Streptomyces sp. HNM0575]|uniref:hypothetical protein n=1 Tax=Streptomyces sp. HNM0575 TaxID=2716338 RepID=UPI00145F0C8E|nr:hypothetical protein [Streptomyces sp. HNM0575]NLU75638.1 hypothetical protein [Streptomyces sp. HNM0575]
MRKLRAAAAVVAMVGSVGMIGAGLAAAQADGESPLAVKCEQDLGDNTLTNQEGGTVNLADALNGGDADQSANQQLCGLENEDAENTSPTPTATGTTPPATGGGAGGGIGTIDVGGAG